MSTWVNKYSLLINYFKYSNWRYPSLLLGKMWVRDANGYNLSSALSTLNAFQWEIAVSLVGTFIHNCLIVVSQFHLKSSQSHSIACSTLEMNAIVICSLFALLYSCSRLEGHKYWMRAGTFIGDMPKSRSNFSVRLERVHGWSFGIFGAKIQVITTNRLELGECKYLSFISSVYYKIDS